MPPETVQSFRTTVHPDEFGEREQDRSLQKRWKGSSYEHSSTLQSPYDNVFQLELLER
jgi:hypothetical protein